MRQHLIISNIFCLLITLFPALGYGANKSPLIHFGELPLNSGQKKRVLDQKIVVHSQVNTLENEKKQSFDFFIVGKHKRSCRFAIKKLKRYEHFKDFIEIVKTSDYDNKSNNLDILLEPPILPGKLRLNFKIDRINGPGVYPFAFEKGFLKGLQGEMHISEYKHRCLFYIWSKWKGKKTKYSDKVMELFAATVSRMAMKKLFRISTTL